MAEEWQKQVSFTKRIDTTSRLAAAITPQSPDVSSREIQKAAQAIEQRLLRQANSVDDYTKLCEEEIAALKETRKSTEESSDTVPTTAIPNLTGPTTKLGPYEAYYHRHGLFSTIFIAPKPSSAQAAFPSYLALKLTILSHCQPPHNAQREARILAQLTASSAPCIIPLLAKQNLHQNLLLVMPYMPLTLEEALAQNILDQSTLRIHLRSLFSALEYIHSQDIIHRDIKPSNILLSAATSSVDAKTYLSDFGIAWMRGDRDSEPVDSKITDVGTTAYRPPELLFGFKAYGAEIDLWAAGCVVAECVRNDDERRKETLFNPGPLGSELGLIKSIFETLGTPNEARWPGVSKLPDWGKMQFNEYPTQPWQEILPKASTKGRDLASNLVKYQSTERMGATDVLKLPFFTQP
ncbi:hypothetical protein MMC25_003941 [Agyrium rufum]|nr:hypothetical protein [Agyrium rufum]